jgi:Tfp pilus assembly protein FimT
MLVACCILAVVSAMAAPMMKNMLSFYRLSGDAHDVFNNLAVAKMRAASDFTKTRLYVDLAAKSARVEVWQKTGTPAWTAEAESTTLSQNDSFGYGGAITPPPNSQTTIGQAPACLNNSGVAIANTACVLFNSRGLPVDSTGSPTGTDAIYISDGATLYGITIAATGLPRLWRAEPIVAAPSWVLQ